MKGGIGWVALAAVLAAGGCAKDHPPVASSRSDMGAAVRAAVAAAGGSEASIRYELYPRCAPNDAVLDGLLLRVHAPPVQVTDRAAVLDRMAHALSAEGLRVEQSSDGDEHLHAAPADGSWRLVVAEGGTADELAVRASGLVDDEQGRDGLEPVIACG